RAGDGDGAWATDVYETEDGLVVKTAMPGVKPEDIRVNLIGNTLTIEGECRMDETPGEGSYHRREHRYGRFRRSFTLPVAVRADEADASLDHGMLTLKLPRSEAERAKRIPIRGVGTGRVIEGSAGAETRAAAPAAGAGTTVGKGPETTSGGRAGGATAHAWPEQEKRAED